jgi:hypothetical protein
MISSFASTPTYAHNIAGRTHRSPEVPPTLLPGVKTMFHALIKGAAIFSLGAAVLLNSKCSADSQLRDASRSSSVIRSTRFLFCSASGWASCLLFAFALKGLTGATSTSNVVGASVEGLVVSVVLNAYTVWSTSRRDKKPSAGGAAGSRRQANRSTTRTDTRSDAR